jgi:hypothetical protein
MVLLCVFRQGIACIDKKTHKICDALVRIENKNVPQAVGRNPDYPPIRFMDALERNVTLPYEWCDTWQVG